MPSMLNVIYAFPALKACLIFNDFKISPLADYINLINFLFLAMFSKCAAEGNGLNKLITRKRRG